MFVGYYTYYELEIRDEITFAKAKEILESLNKKIGWELFTLEAAAADEDIDPSETDYWDVCTEDEAKWYSWKKDMRELSIEFPEVVFGLEGKGEENQDWWYALFKKDKSTINCCVPPARDWS
jgi:hypothetical protein